MERLHDVIAEHRSYVRGSLARLGVSGCALDDAEQEVFLVLVRRVADFDAEIGASYRRWLWGISKNVAAAQHRHAKQARARAGAMVDPGVRPPMEDRVAARDVLAWLDDGVRQVWVARGEGWTAGEIAASMRVPVTTVQWRLRVAQQRVREWASAAGRRCRAVMLAIPRVARALPTTAASTWAAAAFLLIASAAAVEDPDEAPGEHPGDDRSSAARASAIEAGAPRRSPSCDLQVRIARPSIVAASGGSATPRGLVTDQPPRVTADPPREPATRRRPHRRKAPRGQVELLEPTVAPIPDELSRISASQTR